MEKKYPVISKIITTIILLSLITFTLVSCQKARNDMLSSTDTSQASSAENTVSDTSGTALEKEKKAAEKMSAGEVMNITDAAEQDKISYPLAKWYVDNIMRSGSIVRDIKFTGFCELIYFESCKMYLANYSLEYSKETDNLSVLYGTIPEDKNKYILIDAFVTKFYSLEDRWNKIKSNAVFGKLLGDQPVFLSSGVTTRDFKTLIADGTAIVLEFPTSDTTLGVVTKKGNELYLDLIDIINWKSVSDRHTLTSVQGYTIYSGYNFIVNGNKFLISISANNTDRQRYVDILYEITVHSDGRIEDKATVVEDMTTYETNLNSEYDNLRSESGRYQTFLKNSDLYLHDNKLNKDILVYDSKSHNDVEYDHELTKARAAFFIGDVLYYNINGYEWRVGYGVYNPETKENKVYDNEVRVEKHINGYIYCNVSVPETDYAYYYARFKTDEPDNLIRITDNDAGNGDLVIHYTPDGKYLLKVYKNFHLSLKEYPYILTLYDSNTLKELKAYAIGSADYIYDILFIGNRILIPVQSYEAYVITLD
jgi:hypothetical protein